MTNCVNVNGSINNSVTDNNAIPYTRYSQITRVRNYQGFRVKTFFQTSVQFWHRVANVSSGYTVAWR